MAQPRKLGGFQFFLLGLTLALLLAALAFAWPVQAGRSEQQATPAPATVTGTPVGAYIVVNADIDQVNVRAYPCALANCQKVGVLITGQQAPAKGRIGDWILVDYPGIQGSQAWVYSANVTLHGGPLPEVEPPATPTPLYTTTIDPTLAAQFIVTSAPTRLATFTPPGPLVIATYPANSNGRTLPGGIPMALVIIGLGALGVFLALLSLIRGR